MEWIGTQFVRRSPLRALALCAMGTAALAAPGFLDQGLAYAAVAYLIASGAVLAVESCAGGPHRVAGRVGLVMACLLLALAGISVVLLERMQPRVMLYLGLLLAEGAVYLAVALLAFRSAGLAALASVVMVGSLLWMLAAPLGGLVNLHKCLGALLLLSAVYELSARTLWRRGTWGVAL